MSENDCTQLGKSPIDLLEACCAAIKDEGKSSLISAGSKRKRSDSSDEASAVEIVDVVLPTSRSPPNSSYYQPPPLKKTPTQTNSPLRKEVISSGSKGRPYFRSPVSSFSKLSGLRHPLGSFISQRPPEIERILRSWQYQNSQYSLINGLSNWTLYQQQLQLSLAASQHYLPNQMPSLNTVPLLRNFSPALKQETTQLGQNFSSHPEQRAINECRWANCSKSFKTADALSEHVFEHVTATSKSPHSLSSRAKLASPPNSAVSIIGSMGKLV